MNLPPNSSELSQITGFARRLLDWYAIHGRRDLPWQATRDPYPIWISEIMLQQTQVPTVIPYFNRLITRFPNVYALASAVEDEVLHQWAGLGYYTRARNLHKAAQQIVDEHGGQFPTDIDTLQELPGVGRSTAAAILAFSTGRRHAILDGNVKRVLARYYAIDGYPGQSVVQDRLWQRAQRNTPHERVAEYTQAIMDLGATLCMRRKPKCWICPVKTRCKARLEGTPERYPTPKPKKSLPIKRSQMLVLTDKRGRVLLERRPPAGIWGGLWCFPECDAEDDIHQWASQRLGVKIKSKPPLQEIRHTFSHYRLVVVPIPATMVGASSWVMESNQQLWYKPDVNNEIGLAAPVKRLLDVIIPPLKESTTDD